MDSPTLAIGELAIVTRAPDANALCREVQQHFDRIVGSRGLGHDAIEEKYGAMRIVPRCRGERCVEIMATGEDGGERPIAARDLPQCELHETAVGYTVARLAHRGLIGFEQLRTRDPLPNGRRLTDLRPVAISLMPRNVLLALAELHTIGFTGTPPRIGTVRLRLGDACELPTTADDPASLLAEIEELQRRCAEKFDLARGGRDRYGPAELTATQEGPDSPAIRDRSGPRRSGGRAIGHVAVGSRPPATAAAAQRLLSRTPLGAPSEIDHPSRSAR